jgi:hypothetical protein
MRSAFLLSVIPVAALLVACGGSVVFEEDGAGGSGTSSSSSKSGSKSSTKSATQSSSSGVQHFCAVPDFLGEPCGNCFNEALMGPCSDELSVCENQSECLGGYYDCLYACDTELDCCNECALKFSLATSQAFDALTACVFCVSCQAVCSEVTPGVCP